MRILILTPSAGDHFGQERLVRDTSRLLRSVGNEVFILADDFNGDSKEYDGVITVKGASVIYRFTSARVAKQTHDSILNFIDNLKPDILYLVDQFDAKLGEKLIQSYPVVVSVHTVAATCPASSRLIPGANICSRVGGWHCLGNNLRYGCLDHYSTVLHQYLAVERFVTLCDTYKKAHRFVAVSQFIKDTLIANGWDEQRISLVYNPVEAHPVPAQLETPKNLLVCASRLHRIKGVDNLIRACAQIKWLPWTLWICGDGMEEANLREMTEMYGLQDRIIFKGKLTYDLMVTVMKQSLAVIQPNIGAEAFGLASAEASLMGVPVIAANISALNEILIPDKNAIFYDPNRVDELANCMLRVLRRDPILDVLRNEGPALIRNRFGPQTYLRSLTEAFQKTIEAFQTNPIKAAA